MLTFFALLSEHLVWYLACVALVGGCSFYAVRRHIFSVIDPLFFFLVINETFCVADVLFMFRFRMIDPYITTNYLITECALFVGLLQFRPAFRGASPPPLEAVRLPPRGLKVAYVLSFVSYVALNLLVYAQRGIPLLQVSRMQIYRSAGWGILDRIFDVLPVIIVYYLMDVLRRRRWRRAEVGSLFIVLIIEVLSGAKIAVLQLFFIAGLASYFMGTAGVYFSLKSRPFRMSAIAAVAAALVIITIQSRTAETEQQLNPFALLTVRLVTSGDALIYAYPDNYVGQIDSHNPVGALLKEYLAAFRIETPDELPKHIGVQIAQYFTGQGDEFQTNAKHNIFGFVYFGFWGSILYSYLLGTSIGLVRYKLTRILPHNWVAGVIFALMSLGTIGMISELDDVNRYVIDILVILIPLALLSSLIAIAGPARSSGIKPALADVSD